MEEASTGENVTAEENDTDIDITKFLKSPEPSSTKGRGVTETETEVADECKTTEIPLPKDKKMIEHSITFLSEEDEESDFDEKLI